MKAPPPQINVPSLWGYSLRIVLALAVILAIVFLVAYILRKMRVGPPVFGRRKIQILEVTPVMGKWAVAVVKVGGRLFLVGLAEGSIQLLSELSEKDLEEETFEKVLEESM